VFASLLHKATLGTANSFYNEQGVIDGSETDLWGFVRVSRCVLKNLRIRAPMDRVKPGSLKSLLPYETHTLLVNLKDQFIFQCCPITNIKNKYYKYCEHYKRINANIVENQVFANGWDRINRSNLAWAVGSLGTVLKTDNAAEIGALTWTKVDFGLPLPERYNWRALAYVPLDKNHTHWKSPQI
jgi:hypothetical protein